MQAGQGGRYSGRASHDSLHGGLPEGEPSTTPPPVSRSTVHKRSSMANFPDASPDRSAVFRNGNERLYEAYNDLHSLAQDFEKPFDAPAILVVGHQTDGKSGEPTLSPIIVMWGRVCLQTQPSPAYQAFHPFLTRCST
jgi:hypothetical protein